MKLKRTLIHYICWKISNIQIRTGNAPGYKWHFGEYPSGQKGLKMFKICFLKLVNLFPLWRNRFKRLKFIF